MLMWLRRVLNLQFLPWTIKYTGLQHRYLFRQSVIKHTDDTKQQYRNKIKKRTYCKKACTVTVTVCFTFNIAEIRTRKISMWTGAEVTTREFLRREVFLFFASEKRCDKRWINCNPPLCFWLLPKATLLCVAELLGVSQATGYWGVFSDTTFKFKKKTFLTHNVM